MCLVFVAWRAHPRYRLVVAANRDEFHARPTAPAAVWPPAAAAAPDGGTGNGAHAAARADGGAAAGAGRRDVLAGRDLEAGGTWSGVTADGRFAALTNFRAARPPAPGAPSRGRLVAGYLQGALGARGHARRVAREAERYSGFHLLLADRSALVCVSNRADERVAEVPPGCHGLGNDRLNAPEPKVAGGLAAFRRLIRGGFEAEDLFGLLADSEPAAEGAWRDAGRERAHSARFIRGEVYGTRSSTVAWIDDAGGIRFEERSFDAGAAETGRAVFRAAPGTGAAAAGTGPGGFEAAGGTAAPERAPAPAAAAAG